MLGKNESNLFNSASGKSELGGHSSVSGKSSVNAGSAFSGKSDLNSYNKPGVNSSSGLQVGVTGRSNFSTHIGTGEKGAAANIADRQFVGSVNRAAAPSSQKWNFGKEIDMIIIGASAGGADALIEVLRPLPEYLPPVLVVQHMEARFTTLYANRIKPICKMKVSELKDGDVAESGHIYIAPGGYHTTVHKISDRCFFKLDISPKVSGHRPSVNVIFESAAKTLGNKAIGVILTGMGDDGAQGLLKMRNNGAYTIGQDKATCLVYGMPKVAKEIGAVLKQLPLDKIAMDIVFRCGMKPGLNR